MSLVANDILNEVAVRTVMPRKVTPEQKRALKKFYDSVDELKRLRVIRSDKYLGDIAEFLCKVALGLELAKSGRHPGYDGLIDKLKVQVKFSGGKSTTVDCGDPSRYEILFIVVGRASRLRRANETADYLIYQLSNSEVLAFKKSDGKYHCGKSSLPQEVLLRL